MDLLIAFFLIIIVYGFLYERTWGHSLSDQWSGERPNFVIVCALAGVLSSIIPNNTLIKPVVMILLIGFALYLPAKLLSRKVSAFVLIKTKIGKTSEARKMIEEKGIGVSVLFGRYDLIAKVEVPKLKTEEEVMKELSKQVDEKIALDENVTATETLIDYSHISRYWSALERGT